jgi:hypothetical protein
MIEVLVEVDSAATRFGAVVRDESIWRAVEAAKARYPVSEGRAVYPIEPETFFVQGYLTPACSFEVKMSESAAG